MLETACILAISSVVVLYLLSYYRKEIMNKGMVGVDEVHISTAQIVRAVNIANDFRAALGAEPIDDLPKGVRTNPNKCILARAFNFDCGIRPGHVGDYGGAYFHDRKTADTFAALVGTRTRINSDCYGWTENYKWTVPIPAEISDIANAFDQRGLPEYIEYEY